MTERKQFKTSAEPMSFLKWCKDNGRMPTNQNEAEWRASIDAEGIAADRLETLERICIGITDEMIEGGWTALGLSKYAKSLEERIATPSAENHPAQDDVRDAQRYRWLRNEHFPTADKPPVAQVVCKWQSDRHGSKWVNMIDGNNLDDAIDAAIASQSAKEPR